MCRATIGLNFCQDLYLEMGAFLIELETGLMLVCNDFQVILLNPPSCLLLLIYLSVY